MRKENLRKVYYLTAFNGSSPGNKYLAGLRIFARVIICLLLLVCPGCSDTKNNIEAKKPVATEKEIQNLITKFSDSDPNGRTQSEDALAKIGSQAVPALIKVLEDKNDLVVKKCAMSVLGDMGVEAFSAVPILIKTLEEKDKSIIYSASYALGRIRLKAIPTLIEVLEDKNKNGNIRHEVVKILQHISSFIGHEASPAIPALIKALDDGELQYTAAEALAEIGEKAIPALMEVLKGINEEPKFGAAKALGKMGPKALPAIILGLQDEDKSLKIYCAQAISRLVQTVFQKLRSWKGFPEIAYKIEAAEPILINNLNHSDQRVKDESKDALCFVHEIRRTRDWCRNSGIK